MVSARQLNVVKIILFFPFLLAVLYALFVIKSNRIERKRKAISSEVGRHFPNLPLRDVNGNTVSLDLSRTGLTIIDFWYRNCVPCIAEMKQFEELLKGKEQEIAVISISVDDPAAWKTTVTGNDGRFAFMGRPVANWHHLLLDYGADSTGNNNNMKQLAAQLNVSSFPAFFVLDKTGIIKATPASAVAYIQSAGKEEHSFLQFLRSPGKWKHYYLLLLFSVFVYWIVLNYAAKLILKTALSDKGI